MPEDQSRRLSKKDIADRNRDNRRLAVGGLVAATTVGAGLIYLSTHEKPQLSLKETILNFTWDDFENDEKVKVFTKQMAEAYVKLTATSRLNSATMSSPENIIFLRGATKFRDAVRKVDPNFTITLDQWGYAHYPSGKVFIDLASLREQAKPKVAQAGLALVDPEWHEWGHLDLEEKTSGQLINNPEIYFPSPNSGKNELFRRYRGGEIFTDTYFGFARFEEVWNETLIARRLVEQVGLEGLVSVGDYLVNGIDFFPALTSRLGISLTTLYNLHASSDLEGLAVLVGGKLPGNEAALSKGIKLFNGIHQSNPQMIQQSGAFQVIK